MMTMMIKKMKTVVKAVIPIAAENTFHHCLKKEETRLNMIKINEMKTPLRKLAPN